VEVGLIASGPFELSEEAEASLLNYRRPRSVALARAAQALKPVEHRARQQSRIANTTFVLIEFH
jgi:hypothetical protein